MLAQLASPLPVFQPGSKRQSCSTSRTLRHALNANTCFCLTDRELNRMPSSLLVPASRKTLPKPRPQQVRPAHSNLKSLCTCGPAPPSEAGTSTRSAPDSSESSLLERGVADVLALGLLEDMLALF